MPVAPSIRRWLRPRTGRRDRDLARLGLLRLGEREPQQAVLEGGRGRVRVEALWQGDRAGEATAAHLAHVVAVLLGIRARTAARRQGERVAQDRDVDVLRLDARQGGLEDERVGGLDRCRAASRRLLARAARRGRKMVSSNMRSMARRSDSSSPNGDACRIDGHDVCLPVGCGPDRARSKGMSGPRAGMRGSDDRRLNLDNGVVKSLGASCCADRLSPLS